MTIGAAKPQRESSRPAFQVSVEQRLLCGLICELAEGAILTHGETTRLIGLDAQKEGRSILYAARKMAERDNRVITAAIPGVGIKRLTDSEATQASTATFAHIRRTVRRDAARLAAVKYENLSPADQLRWNASQAANGVLGMMASEKSLKRIEANASGGELPIARTLELFRGPQKT